MKKVFIAGFIGGLVGVSVFYILENKTKLILPKYVPKGKPAGTYEIEDWENSID